MSLGMLLYLAGMATVFVGQRLLDGLGMMQWVVSALGLAAVLTAALLRALRARRAKDEGLGFGHRVALVLLLVGTASLVLYAATIDGVVRAMTLGDEAEARWLGVWRSLWPVVWLLGTLPLLVVDYALESSPVVMPRRRIRDMVTHGLAAAMGIALVFPVNFIANERKEHTDLAYFKTPKPGTATEAIVAGLQQPVTVRIFMPPSSEVTQEIRNYFTALGSPNLTVEVIDQAAQPRLANALSVRENGIVAFTAGEVDVSDRSAPDGMQAQDKPRPVTRTLRVGSDFDKAKRKLKNLDAEVQRLLIEVGMGERVAYMTTGHGELETHGTPQIHHSAKAFKSLLGDLGFRVKPLGLTQGLGDKVPSDADVVFILGPQVPFTEAEVDSLRRYVEQGGSVLVALEPRETLPPTHGADPLLTWVEELGVKLGAGVLATERGVVRITNNKLDRFNVTTNSITSHKAVMTVAENARQLILFFFATGFLEEADTQPHKVSFLVRSPATTWADKGTPNADFEPQNGEAQSAEPVLAAIEGGEGNTAFRMIVSADSTVFADLTQVAHPSFGNDLLLRDLSNWLVGAETLSGTTQSEEDLKIQHTREGQTWWFYLTVVLIPLVVLVLGALRVRWRRRSGTTGAGDRDAGGEA